MGNCEWVFIGDYMQIQVDTREHKEEWERISKQFDELGVKYFRSKLYCGDYQSMDNTRLVIDRKKDLQEICGNICQQHERFKDELIRAMEQGIKIIVLCEHGPDITCIEDVMFWDNPRRKIMAWKTLPNGKKTRVQKYPRAVNGDALYKSLCTIRDRYNVQFEFCTKEQTGKRIVELLSQ